ncbi:MAG TPA: hypothetical protein VF590_08445, partial [Isosphaeraceae bacterium]
AWVLARCAALATNDPTLPAPQRLAQEEIYALRAVALIRQAFGQGLRNLDELNQPEFDRLRHREDFRKLFEEIQAASRTATG